MARVGHLAPPETGGALTSWKEKDREDEATTDTGSSGEESIDGANAPSPPLYMYMLALCAALNSTNDGFDIGVGAGVSTHLQEEMQLTDLQVGIFFGSLSFMAALGGLTSHRISDHFGRRLTFVAAQVVVIVGIAAVCSSRSFAGLMAGRVLVGVGVGIGFSIDPLYIAEVAPATHRGELTAWCEVALSMGVTLGFVANWAFKGLPPGVNWRVMVGSGAVLPVLLVFLALFVMPESPRWLVSRGRSEEALKVLRRTHPAGQDVDALVHEMEREVQRTLGQKRLGWRPLLCPAKGHRRAVLVGLGIALGQQATCQATVTLYAARIFKHAGIGGDDASRLGINVLLGVVKTLCVGIAAYFLDSRGRRPLLLISTWGMVISVLLIALGISAGPHWLAVAAVFGYSAVFSLGLGPVTWVYAAELFPSHLRAKAMGLSVFLNRLTNALVTLSFLPIANALGSQAAFFVGASCVTALLATGLRTFAPETKQRTLEQLGKQQDPKGMLDCLGGDEESDSDSGEDQPPN